MNRRMRGEKMSILIKNMEMPEDCRECPLEQYYMNCGETRCRAENKILADNFKAIPFNGRPDFCPLVEVPAPHGRLIDADELANKTFYSKTNAPYITYWRFVNAPTIIEAEGTE